MFRRRTIPTSIWKTLAIACSSLAAAKTAAAPAAVQLSNLPIEQLMQFEVDTGTKHTQKIADVPAVVSIVTAEDIKTYGYRSLSEILGSVRGLHTTYDRNYNYLGVRGFAVPGDYNTRVLLLVDGFRHNDSVYDQASIGTDFDIDIDLIERVEFLAGPASAVYGSNALFGVINVVTKTGADFKGVNVSTRAGSYRTGKGRVTAGGAGEDGASWLFSATRYTQRGDDQYYEEFDTPDQNDGVAVDADYDRSTSFLAKYRRENFVVTLSHSDRTKGIPTASYEQVFNDNDAYTRDVKTNLGADYRYRIDESSTLTGKLYAGRSLYEGDYIYADTFRFVNRDESEGLWFGGELQFGTTLGQHDIVTGAEYRRDIDIEQTNFDVAPYLSIMDDERSSGTASVYIQDEYRIDSALLLNTGVRVDKATGTEATTSPRIGLIYTLDTRTMLKLLYGSAYRTPNAFEKYYYPAIHGADVQRSLDNERLESGEIVVEYALNPSQRLSLSLFRNEVKDLIALSTNADGELFFNNIADATIQGAEIEWQAGWANGVRARASYNWQQERDRTTEVNLGRPPRHLVKLNLTGPLYRDRLSYGLDVRGVSARSGTHGEAGGYGTMNATLRFTPEPQWEVAASVYNLFDRDYADPGSSEHIQEQIQQDRRTFQVRVDYWF